jgi:Helix-hairpin-helix motif
METHSAAAKVDLNTASQQELAGLPAVGPAMAKKIVAGRPYKTVDDLSKAGVSKRQIAEIAPLVTVASRSSANRADPDRGDANRPDRGRPDAGKTSADRSEREQREAPATRVPPARAWCG